MTNRREFLQTTAGALSGLVFVGCDLMAAAPARAQARRRGGGRQRQAGEDSRRARPLRGAGGAGADEPEARRAGAAARPRHGDASGGAAAGHGRAGHRRRGAEHQPQLVQDGSRPRQADHQDPEREAGGGVRREPGAVRRLRHGGAAASRSRRRAARGGREEVRPARGRHRRQRRRRGDQRPEVPPVLGQGRGARRGGVHPSAGRRRPGAAASGSRATATSAT